jgi:hypothetical protein
MLVVIGLALGSPGLEELHFFGPQPTPFEGEGCQDWKQTDPSLPPWKRSDPAVPHQGPRCVHTESDRGPVGLWVSLLNHRGWVVSESRYYQGDVPTCDAVRALVPVPLVEQEGGDWVGSGTRESDGLPFLARVTCHGAKGPVLSLDVDPSRLAAWLESRQAERK